MTTDEYIRNIELSTERTKSMISGHLDNIEIGDKISIMYIETVWYKKLWRWVTFRPQEYVKYFTVDSSVSSHNTWKRKQH